MVIKKSPSLYRMQPAFFRSSGFYTHQAIVADRYVREGFISTEDAENLVDTYDTPDTMYCLLYQQTAPENVAGTFRLIPGTIGLPLLSIFPHLCIEGIRARFCESTRVVSLKRDIAGRSDPSRHVLFETVMQSVAYAGANNLLGVVSMGSPSVFTWINAVFSGCQRALAAPCTYSGGMVIPSIIWVDEFEARFCSEGSPYRIQYYETKAAWVNEQ